MSDDDRDGYEVGFGKPPKNRRFKRGVSGNPKGRPKGRLNTATILRNACLEKVPVKTPRGSKYISKHQAAVTQLVNKAASGDIKALAELRVWLGAYPELSEALLNPPQIHVHFVKPDGNGGILREDSERNDKTEHDSENDRPDRDEL